MSDAVVFRESGYRYIKAVFQYSSGVAAEPGFEIERAPCPSAAARRGLRRGRGAPRRARTRELLI